MRALIDEIKSPLQRERLMTEMNQLIDAMWSADAKVENLLDVFLEENCPYEDFWLEVAMRARLGVDAEHVLAWFAAHGTKLRATLRDRAVLALCRYYCGLLEWKKARELHGTLMDEELISVVDSEIGAAMDRRLRRDVMIDPEAVMSSLLEKDSGYEVFWLEVAMNELLVKNPIVAGEWYQSNKSSFTPEQHERIALACLRMQLGQNQIKEARQWRLLIVSSELAAVVDRELGEEVVE
ncbi:MAG: hypothetical protein CAK88_03425 [Verrucomicrobiia bacterium AMD-G2]|nr:MAG: hypothetical protein CAK88_03425 [Verrucomicrobiae bacterium AMD-G2]